ncbi:MAG: hypothetical protein QM611_09345 [Microbacterium sp.]|uniref:hypothetical protein n=1 Tax=Microbacterium sp. TaxID=51671 RepID=UPI0039E2F23A
MEVRAISDPQRAPVHALRAQIERAQGRRLDASALPVLPALAPLLPGGGLRLGSAYALESSAALTTAVMAGPSQAGSWCAAVGMPELGAEAGERAGVALDRLVLVPEPGPRWLAVVATLVEVVPVVAVRPPGRARDGDVARLGARLRDRGAVLLVQGPWPQAEASLCLSEPAWIGLGRGHGLLSRREVTVTAASRRWPVPRSARVALPGRDGAVAAVAEGSRGLERMRPGSEPVELERMVAG